MEKAQSVLEYAAVICIVVGAVLLMQVYVKRAIEGKMRNSSEEIGAGLTYSPKATVGNSIMNLGINESSNSSVSWSSNNTIETSITNSVANIVKTINRIEQTLNLADEPVRN